MARANVQTWVRPHVTTGEPDSQRLLEEQLPLLAAAARGPAGGAVVALGVRAGLDREPGFAMAGIAQHVAGLCQKGAADALALVARRDQQCPDGTVARIGRREAGDKAVRLL